MNRRTASALRKPLGETHARRSEGRAVVEENSSSFLANPEFGIEPRTSFNTETTETTESTEKPKNLKTPSSFQA
jgi:hypothetical protein